MDKRARNMRCGEKGFGSATGNRIPLAPGEAFSTDAHVVNLPEPSETNARSSAPR